jgi:glutamate decarboxylase
MPLHSTRPHHEREDPAAVLDVRPQFASAEMGKVPRNRLPEGEMDGATAYQIVHDELMLDGNARLNLATFVTTWMDEHAGRLMAECTDKNMIDKDEYPQTAELERRCVTMLADLWHAPETGAAVGCSTTGSSEACMLAGMALLRRWRARRDAGGMPADRPNLVMGANVQVCWEKFCRYWDVEARLVPCSADSTHLTPAGAVEHCDEQTIGVVAVLGSTFDGSYEPVADIAAALDRLNVERGLDVPVHVDAASGGFVAPFLDPDLEWDFRLRRVQSINASGHKYGLVYPGVGWALWRDQAALPDELVFHVDYLGGDMPTFALNFSRPGAQVVAQYYTMLRLGFEGYRRVQQSCRDTARRLADDVAAMAPFELLTDGSELPVLAFRRVPGLSRAPVGDGGGGGGAGGGGGGGRADWTVYDVADALRMRGWLVPAYPMPPAIEDVSVLRIVVRNGFGPDLASMLVADLRRTVESLERGGHGGADEARPSFHH